MSDLGDALGSAEVMPEVLQEALDSAGTPGASAPHACSVPDRARFIGSEWTCSECRKAWAWQPEFGCWSVVGLG